MQVQCKLVRKDGTKVEVNGQQYHFKPNGEGHHVADVTDAAALHRLINEIPEAYALYGDDAGKTVARIKAAPTTEHPLDPNRRSNEPATLVVTDGDGKQIDLMAMERAELASFATTEFGIEVHPRWKEDTIRNKVVEAIRVAASVE